MSEYVRTDEQRAALLAESIRDAGEAIGRCIYESADAEVFWHAVLTYAYLRFPDSAESLDTATSAATLQLAA